MKGSGIDGVGTVTPIELVLFTTVTLTGADVWIKESAVVFATGAALSVELSDIFGVGFIPPGTHDVAAGCVTGDKNVIDVGVGNRPPERVAGPSAESEGEIITEKLDIGELEVP